MTWNVLEAAERYLFSTMVTVVTLGIAIGLAFWVWSDRFFRGVPSEADLVEISGQVAHSMAHPRSGVVWLDLKDVRSSSRVLPEVTAVRVHARDTQKVATTLSAASGEVRVTAWVVRAEIDVATSRNPPSALELRIANESVVSYSEGRSVREEHAANARLSAWVAGSGAVVSLAVLLLYWTSRLRA